MPVRPAGTSSSTVLPVMVVSEEAEPASSRASVALRGVDTLSVCSHASVLSENVSGKPSETLKKAERLRDMLLLKSKELILVRNAKQDSIAAVIDQTPRGREVDTAIHYKDFNLIEQLKDLEEAIHKKSDPGVHFQREEMSNSDFLIRSLRLLCDSNAELADWEKVKTQRVEGYLQDSFNLEGRYRTLVNERAGIYAPIVQARAQLETSQLKKAEKESELLALTQQEQELEQDKNAMASQKTILDKNIGKWVHANAKKNQDKINHETKIYLDAETSFREIPGLLEKNQLSQTQIQELIAGIQRDIECYAKNENEGQKDASIYEKKLKLLQIMLGYLDNEDQTRANPIRIEFIKSAVEVVSGEINKEIQKINQKELAVDKCYAELDEEIRHYANGGASFWDRISGKHKIKTLIKQAEKLLG